MLGNHFKDVFREY